MGGLLNWVAPHSKWEGYKNCQRNPDAQFVRMHPAISLARDDAASLGGHALRGCCVRAGTSVFCATLYNRASMLMLARHSPPLVESNARQQV